MKVKIYESGPNIPARYYAVISDGIAYFASMEDHFDWAIDMLAEDGNDDSVIGLMVNGECVKTWSREEVGL